MVNDAEDNFPSRDAFIVYPGKGGKPLSSLRLETLSAVFSDYRVLCLLEGKFGREMIWDYLYSLGFGDDFSSYPREEGILIRMREKIDEAILASDPNPF